MRRRPLREPAPSHPTPLPLRSVREFQDAVQSARARPLTPNSSPRFGGAGEELTASCEERLGRELPSRRPTSGTRTVGFTLMPLGLATLTGARLFRMRLPFVYLTGGSKPREVAC